VYDYATKSLVKKGEIHGPGSHENDSLGLNIGSKVEPESSIFAKGEQILYQPVPPQNFDVVPEL
jgi:hypothetical protein